MKVDLNTIDSCDGYKCNIRNSCLFYQNFINNDKISSNILLNINYSNNININRGTAIKNKCSYYKMGKIIK